MPLLPFTSRLIADVGISLGDEGKGRLIPEVVHELAGGAHPVTIVLKVNGGANSGHTAAGVKLNLLPSGVVEKEIPTLAIGAGVVADPRKAWWEAQPLERKGYNVLARLVIDERAMVSDLSHRLLDLAWEDYRVHVLAEEPRGSTGRGITPAYQDEVGQWQITYADFLGGPNYFARKLAQRADRAMAHGIAREEIVHPQHAGLGRSIIKKPVQGLGIQTRHMHVRNQARNRQQQDREENPGLQLRNLEAVGEGLDEVAKHGWLSR